MSVSANAGVPHSAISYTSNLVVTTQINSLSGNLVLNPAGDIDLSGKKIINAATPSGPDDGVTKSYADGTYTTAPVSTVTDSAIATYDGTTGKLLKESPITISNLGVISSSSGITITPGAGQSLNINADTRVNGNLLVTGTTTTVNTDQMLVKDNSISLNNGYTATTTKPCGIVSNYSATTTTANVASGGFVAGVASTSNPTVAVSADVFVAGDIIQISGANNISNNGIFEVQSNTGGVLTICGVGVTGLTYDLFQNQFTTDTTVAGVIYKININALYMSGTTTYKLTGSNTASVSLKILATSTTASTVDSIPSFADTDGGMYSPSTSTAADLFRPINISPPAVTGTNLYAFTADGTVNGAGRVYGRINNNAAGNSSASLFLGKPFVNATSLTWEFGTDSTVNNTDNFYIRHNKTGKMALTIGATDIISFDTALSGPRYDFTTVAANPGSTTTLWVNTTGTALSFGASKVLTSAAATTINAIPAFSTTTGVTSVAATTTAATLARPITISAGNTTTAATISTANADCTMQVATSLTSTNRGSITFGKTAFSRWLMGSDSALNNTDDFFISKFGSGIYAVKINNSDHLVNAQNGFISTRYDITAAAANPGSTTTVWNNSTDSNRLYHGVNRLAYASEIGAGSIGAVSPATNSLVSFSDASPGNVKSPDATVTATQSLILTKTSTTTDSLVGLRRVGTNTTGINLQVLPTIDANIIYLNGYQDVASGPIYHKAAKSRWALVNDCNNTNDLFKIEILNAGVTTVPLTINASDSILMVPAGISLVPANDSTGQIVIGPGKASAKSTTMVLQALTGGAQGLTAINFNGYYNAGEQRFNTGKNRWRFYCDQRSTTDTIVLDTYNGSDTTVFTASTDGLFTTNIGAVSKRYDITSNGSNPGGTNTFWRNSADSNRLYDNANKLALYSELPLYQVTSVSVSFAGAWNPAVVGTVGFVRIGSVVFINMPFLSGTTSSANLITATSTGYIPVGYRPTNNTYAYFTVRVGTAGSPIVQGLLGIGSNGGFTVQTYSPFTGGGTFPTATQVLFYDSTGTYYIS